MIQPARGILRKKNMDATTKNSITTKKYQTKKSWALTPRLSMFDLIFTC